MYTLTCAAGYPNPIREGKFEIFGMSATVNDVSAAARVRLIDNSERKIFAPSYSSPSDVPIIDEKVVAGEKGTIQIQFSEPIKLRKGLSVVNADNIVVGSLKVFAR